MLIDCDSGFEFCPFHCNIPLIPNLPSMKNNPPPPLTSHPSPLTSHPLTPLPPYPLTPLPPYPLTPYPLTPLPPYPLTPLPPYPLTPSFTLLPPLSLSHPLPPQPTRFLLNQPSHTRTYTLPGDATRGRADSALNQLHLECPHPHGRQRLLQQ